MTKKQYERGDFVLLSNEGMAELRKSDYSNEDLRPTRAEERTWSAYNMASLWIGMSVCIPTYTLASGLIAAGMNWWQAVLTIVLGNAIVLVPMILNAHAGTRYGVPYPVFARLWFGTKGAHIPSLMRAIVAAGWFGIQTWIGGSALDALLSSLWSGWANIPLHLPIAFLAFWALNVWIGYKGPEAIRSLESWGAPLLLALGLCLLVWAYKAAGGFGPMLSAPSKFKTTGEFLAVFFPALTGMIGFWSTLALNIPDFSRYAKSQKAQILGQIMGLPTTMGLFSFIGVAVTSATVVVFGEAIWDPVVLLSKFPPLVVTMGTVGIVLATITTNIAANVVAPARAIENLFPRKFTFGLGAIVTGIIGIAMQPWALLANYAAYIFGWLGTYAAFLGPLDGVAIADYWLVRQKKIDLVDLYQASGRYHYSKGINLRAIIALGLGILVALSGRFIPALGFLTDNAWIVGLFVSAASYWYLMRGHGSVLSDEEFRAITDLKKTTETVSQTAEVALEGLEGR
uniref:NCS1 family nucleobase:cation symporter-1 n=1 Tax=Thermatribacter velox TaxID=3039681 RepID=UPI003F689B8C